MREGKRERDWVREREREREREGGREAGRQGGREAGREGEGREGERERESMGAPKVKKMPLTTWCCALIVYLNVIDLFICVKVRASRDVTNGWEHSYSSGLPARPKVGVSCIVLNMWLIRSSYYSKLRYGRRTGECKEALIKTPGKFDIWKHYTGMDITCVYTSFYGFICDSVRLLHVTSDVIRTIVVRRRPNWMLTYRIRPN